MENKRNLLIIISALIILTLLVFFYFNNNQEETESINQQSEQEESEEVFSLDPVVEQAVNIRQTSEMIHGTLYEVGDKYIVIEQSVPEENQEALDPQSELKYIQERIKVNINPSAEIFDLSDVSYVVVPSEITGAMETLNYLYGFSDEYIIYIYVSAESPITNGETETDYIEWSLWPRS